MTQGRNAASKRRKEGNHLHERSESLFESMDPNRRE